MHDHSTNAEEVATWHHGVVARWWAEFVQGGSEVDYLRAWIEPRGGKVLDVGCGTGRLLLPYLRAGIDVEGTDAAADMLSACRALAEREGLSPRLHHQPLHQLDLPDLYRTIYLCGVFGLGSSRADDDQGLRRLLRHLEPDGMLLINHYVGWADDTWKLWLPEHRARLPQPIPEAWEPSPASDGSALRLRARVLAFDPDGPTIHREMLAESFRDGEPESAQTYRLSENLYFPNEIALLLERAGFSRVQVKNDHPASIFGPAGSVFTIVARR